MVGDFRLGLQGRREVCAAPETAFDVRRRSVAEKLEVQADDDTLSSCRNRPALPITHADDWRCRWRLALVSATLTRWLVFVAGNV